MNPSLEMERTLTRYLGLQDTNLARVRATQDYLMRCDNIFIVTNIARAITNSSLCSSLFSVMSRHKPQDGDESRAKNQNIAIVCTRSDVCRSSVPPLASMKDAKSTP
ncbi:hypothetical protein IMZ48_34945 [Candidatus Bathyarchaeota archaeon]|nr:hypothetical protein [Candidatus Bathyarchaeota archaeon]